MGLYSVPTHRYTARRDGPLWIADLILAAGPAGHSVGPSAPIADAAREGSAVSFTDQSLTCRDCESIFVFSAGEQAFFAEKGLTNQPQRCPQCRANRRRERNGQPPRELHSVPCAECGAMASVPFLPRLDRPVYCSSCFDRVRSAASV
jgi:CxxC-x17-CxxC domain-containing protein